MGSKSQVNGQAGGRFTTAADLIRGGRSPYRSVTLKDFDAPIFYKPLKAGAVLQFMEEVEQEGITNRQRSERMVDVLVDTLVTPDGDQLVTREQLMEVPMDTLTELVQAITAERKQELGNVSGGTQSASSPSA